MEQKKISLGNLVEELESNKKADEKRRLEAKFLLLIFKISLMKLLDLLWRKSEKSYNPMDLNFQSPR